MEEEGDKVGNMERTVQIKGHLKGHVEVQYSRSLLNYVRM